MYLVSASRIHSHIFPSFIGVTSFRIHALHIRRDIINTSPRVSDGRYIFSYITGYDEFRALLTRKATSLEDNVLCSLDLLLPHTGGWCRSQNLQNKMTRDILSKAGIDFCLENMAEYIEMYLRNLHLRGLLM